MYEWYEFLFSFRPRITKEASKKNEKQTANLVTIVRQLTHPV